MKFLAHVSRCLYIYIRGYVIWLIDWILNELSTLYTYTYIYNNKTRWKQINTITTNPNKQNIHAYSKYNYNTYIQYWYYTLWSDSLHYIVWTRAGEWSILWIFQWNYKHTYSNTHIHIPLPLIPICPLPLYPYLFLF